MRQFIDFQVSPITRNITWATTVRWFGWGIVETLIPVFIFSIVGSYGETGLLKSIYNITFFISLPLIGMLADRVSLKWMLLVGLGMYFLIGGSYFFAAATGSVLFIFIARALNGIAWAADNTARETAFLRYDDHPGRAFAFFETTSNFWWVVSIVASLFLAPFVHIKWLFLGIVVANFFAFPFIARLPQLKVNVKTQVLSFKKMFQDTFRFSALSYIDAKERLLIIFSTIVPSLILVLPMTFLPIFSYLSSQDIRSAILIGGLTALPGIASMFIGKVSDTIPHRSVIFGFLLLALSFIVFVFAGSLVMQLCVAFLAGLAAQMIYLSSMVLVKRSVGHEQLGSVAGLLASLGALGEIVGGISIGFMIDRIDPRLLAFFVAAFLVFSMVMFAIFWRRKM